MQRMSNSAEAVNKSITTGLSVFIKPPPQTASEWADENFYLSAESSYTEGRWTAFPFQVAILNAMGNDDISILDFLKSARVGYSKMILASIAYHAEHKRRNQILWQPTDGSAVDFMKAHVDTMIRDVKKIRAISPWVDMKHRDNTQSNKIFTNRKQFYCLGGASAKNYREKSADTVYFDELSSFEENVEKEGSPISLGDKRTEGSVFRKSIRGSTPKIEGACLISKEANYAEHFFRRYVPCPCCGEFQVLKFGGRDEKFGLKWDEGKPETAFYLCEHNGCVIENNSLPDMDRGGIWRSDSGLETHDSYHFRDSVTGEEKETPMHVAFHIWTIYSPMTSWKQIVVDFLRAKMDSEKLMTFTNTTLGEVWVLDAGEQLDWELLYNRREHYQAQIPDGVAYLTCAIDTQDDRFEFEIKGWGAGLESWSIDYRQIYGNLSTNDIWKLLAELITKTYIDRHGREYTAGLITIDSGGHYTSEVYEFCRKMGRKFVIPIKGSSTAGQQIEKFPNKPTKEKVYLTMVGTDNAKLVIHNHLKQMEVGAGYCHYPVKESHNEEYFKMLTAEKYVIKVRGGRSSAIWVAGGRRNEAWDCHVYNLAAIKIAIRKFGVDVNALATSLWGAGNVNFDSELLPKKRVRKKRAHATKSANTGSKLF